MKKILSAFTIFLGSCLVFGVQPMVGNTLLPIFGGTAAVWMVCLCAFQTLLLIGYFYAHLVAREGHISARTNVLHLALLVFSACWIILIAFRFHALIGWTGEMAYPTVGTLLAVLLLVGVPYTLLSSNASLVQALSTRMGGNAYKLYAVSNVGSFCGLLAYPLLMEPFFGIRLQWLILGCGMACYAFLLAFLMHVTSGKGACSSAEANVEEKVSDVAGESRTNWEWLGLSALSCFMLNAISAHLCNDVTPLPLLWAVMLALYLLSWTVGFTDRGSRWNALAALAVGALLLFLAAHAQFYAFKGYFVELGSGCLLIFFAGWMIHGRLYRLRPGNALLTRYYLHIAIGGAIGGTAASILCPMVFNTVLEYPIALVILVLPALYECHHPVQKFTKCGNLDWRWVVGIVVAFALIVHHYASIANGNVVLNKRNFYGTGRVLQQRMDVIGGEDYWAHMFEHAGIQHGMQAVERCYRRHATMCFSAHAGGLSITKHPKYEKGEPMRVAVCGMGIGTLATFAHTNDVYRFYDINPQVKEIAVNTNLFWYLSDCEARTCEVVIDDARRALEKERARQEPKWDVIIVDVFAGDSIPPHMATKEAVQLYLDRLAPGGILSFHLTNWHLALSPIVKAIAREFNLHLQGFGCSPDKWTIGSYWTFLTREPIDLYIEGKHGKVNYSKIEDIPLMTDDKHSLLPYISMNPMPKFGE